MKIAITGHRPEDLDNPEWVREALKEVLVSLDTSLLIQGMAAGADLLSAEIAYELNIPYVSARPWATHYPRIEDKELYDRVLERSEEVVMVSSASTYVGPHLYHMRNEYMVDRADTVVAIWSGKKTGGTAACVRYAKKVGKPVIQINPITMKVSYSEENTLF